MSTENGRHFFPFLSTPSHLRLAAASNSSLPLRSSSADRHESQSGGLTIGRLQRNISSPIQRSLNSQMSSRINKTSSIKASKPKKFNTRYPLPEKPRQKRAVIQDMVRPLKQWLLRHRHNPYPTKSEKIDLAIGSNMTLVQVSNWFANARRRLKNVVQDPKCSWSKRLRMYNQFVQGNAEALSIASDDSIWNSESEGDQDQDQISEIDVVEVSDAEDRDEQLAEETNLNKYKKSMLQRYLSDTLIQSSESQAMATPKSTITSAKRPLTSTAKEAVGDADITRSVPMKKPKPSSANHNNQVIQPRPILPSHSVIPTNPYPLTIFPGALPTTFVPNWRFVQQILPTANNIPIFGIMQESHLKSAFKMPKSKD